MLAVTQYFIYIYMIKVSYNNNKLLQYTSTYGNKKSNKKVLVFRNS